MSTITSIQEIQKMSMISTSGNKNLPELITSVSTDIMNVYIPIALALVLTLAAFAVINYLRKVIKSNNY